MHPSTVTNQPIMALKPKGASEDGNRKMPIPMVLPTTSAVHIQKPSLRWPFVVFSPLVVTSLAPVQVAADVRIVRRPRRRRVTAHHYRNRQGPCRRVPRL